MRDTVIEVLKGHFGNDYDINDNTHMMDDLGGDELDILDVVVQVESALDISIPEQETFNVRLVSELLEVVGRHVRSD